MCLRIVDENKSDYRSGDNERNLSRLIKEHTRGSTKIVRRERTERVNAANESRTAKAKN